MARRRIPERVRDAIGAHARQAHGAGEVEEAQIGRVGAQRASISFTWEPGDERGPRFNCRLCDEGWGRYYVEVEAPAPSKTLLERIRRHFAEKHEIAELAMEDVYCTENQVREAKANFVPLTPARGAGIVCAMCPQGMNRIYVTEPPHGDARRLLLLLQQNPGLRQEVMGRTSKEQAEYLEAHDLGLLRASPRLVRRALHDRKSGAAAARQDPLEVALARLLVRRVEGGERITHVIKQLAALAKQRPVEFTSQVAGELPGLWHGGNEKREQVATSVAAFLLLPEGSYPTVSERKLWELWRSARFAASTAPSSRVAPLQVAVAGTTPATRRQ